jgi:hypothetical protein
MITVENDVDSSGQLPTRVIVEQKMSSLAIDDHFLTHICKHDMT